MNKLLAIVNKALAENKKIIVLPNIKKSLILTKLLYKQNIITDYSIIFTRIKLKINIYNNEKLFNKFKFYKNLNKYVTYKQLKKMVYIEKKQLILTTIIGVITSDIALKNRIGGCILIEYII